MPLPSSLIGKSLGTFDVVAPLGAGGMGEVYRALDRRLGRDVALKVLPEELTHDPKRRARFEREARLIGSVTHPNILSLFEIGESDGIMFAIFELLEGRTLRDRLASGPVPARRAAEIAAGIARGLAAAHAKGVVHRDLKPENVFLMSDGGVKVLDFGLARQMTRDEDSEASAEAQTEDLLTKAETILGTVGYLSPEQVRRGTVDHRSDIFALGCVLHEMLSGQRPFTGESTPEILTAVLREQPSAIDPPPTLPGLIPIVDRCLDKNPDRRFQSASDLAFALDSLSSHSSTAITARKAITGPRPFSRRLLLVGAIITAAVLGFGLAKVIAPTDGWNAPPTFRRITFRRGSIFHARFAPGGTSVFYAASWSGAPAEVYETTLGQDDARSLHLAPATLLSVSDKDELAVALSPSFPLTYYQPGQLAVVPATGGVPPRELLDDVSAADWDPVTGELAVVRTLDDQKDQLEWPLGHPLCKSIFGYNSLRVAPDGRRVAFFDYSNGQATVVILDREGNRTDLGGPYGIISGGLAWSPDGQEVWFTAKSDRSPPKLWAVRPGGKPRLVLDLPGSLRLQDIAPDGRVLLTVSNLSTSLYGGETSSTETRDLTWYGNSQAGDLSSEGARVLFSDVTAYWSEEGVSWYLRSLTGEPPVRLTFSGSERLPIFGGKLSPDGRFALFQTRDERSFLVEPVGAGMPTTVKLPASIQFVSSFAWLPDGQGFIFVGERDGAESLESFEQLLDGSPPRPLRPVTDYNFVLSPDGSWIASLLEDGSRLRLVRMRGAEEEEREVTPDAPLGTLIRWSADGSAVFFYRNGEVPGGIYRIEVATGHVSLVRRLMPPDPAGVLNIHPVMSDDGRYYAYSASRTLSDLYVFEGLH